MFFFFPAFISANSALAWALVFGAFWLSLLSETFCVITAFSSAYFKQFSVTSETYKSSVINLARGPDFPTAVKFTVKIFFLGYTPQRAVPPQSTTAIITSSSGTPVEKPSTASPPVISAILVATGCIPPPVTLITL